MSDSFRIIAFDDLRDAIDDVALVEVSDADLAERGLSLVNEETLRDGLGPSRFVLAELVTGEQYLVHRLQLAPFDGVFIVATLTGDAAMLADRLLDVLGLSPDSVTWRVEPDFWNQRLREYRAGGKEDWENRRRASSGT